MRSDLIPVVFKMQRIAEKANVELDFDPRQGPMPCPGCGGFECVKDVCDEVTCGSYCRNTAFGDSQIMLAYDELKITPEEMFWTFGHELGHAMQHRYYGFLDNSRAAEIRAEIDAWDYAEALANLTEWPVNQHFWDMRARALRSHKITDEQAPLAIS